MIISVFIMKNFFYEMFYLKHNKVNPKMLFQQTLAKPGLPFKSLRARKLLRSLKCLYYVLLVKSVFTLGFIDVEFLERVSNCNKCKSKSKQNEI